MKSLFFYIFWILLGVSILYLYIANPLVKIYNFPKLISFWVSPTFFSITFLLTKYRFQQRLFGVLFMLFLGGYYFLITPDNMKVLGISLGAVLLAGALGTFFWLKYKSKSTTKEE